MESIVLNLKLTYARLAWPIHFSRTNQKAGFNISIPLFVCGNLSNKKTWETFNDGHNWKDLCIQSRNQQTCTFDNHD